MNIGWANVVNLRDWSGNNRIATTFPSDYRNPTFPRYDIGRDFLLPTAEGLIFFPRYSGIEQHWTLTDGTTALSDWLKANKISSSLSDAGRSSQQIIHTLGGLGSLGNIAAPDIVKLLNEMSRRPISRSAHYKEFQNKINAAIGKDIWQTKAFEVLVKRKAVELGLELKCTKCGSWGWHALNQLDDHITCDLCFKEFNFPITNPIDSKTSKWAYRVIGPFAQPDYARGGYSAALAIRFFSNALGGITEAGITWSAGLDLVFSSNKKSEADFVLWYCRKQVLQINYPAEIVFGEAKSFGKEVFENKDVERLKVLAETFPGAVLVFATMNGQFITQYQIDKNVM